MSNSHDNSSPMPTSHPPSVSSPSFAESKKNDLHADQDDEFKKTSHSTVGKPSTPAAPLPNKEAKPSLTVDDNNDSHAVEDMEALAHIPSGRPLHSVFTPHQKQYIVFMTALGGLFSPLSASSYFPTLNTLSRDLHVSNGLINLTLTTYLIFQGLAPAMYGDLADAAGRRPAYLIGFVVYIAANIGLATQSSFPALLVLRCLQSSGSSGTIALANGIVADIATAGERGKYIGFVLSGAMIGPCIGPILGGILSQFLGWRAIFWFLVIAAGAYLVVFAITFPETGRNVVGNGSIPPQGWNMSVLNYLNARRITKKDELNRTVSQNELRAQHQASQAPPRHKLRFPNPLNTLSIVFEKDVGILLFYNSLMYTAFYDLIGSIPYLFAEVYGFNDLQIGLCFIPYGVGGILAMYLGGRSMDWNYKRVATVAGISVDKKRGDDMKTFPIEKARLQVVWPFLAIGAAALLCYGWAMERNAPLAVPLVLTFIVGLFLTGAFNVQSTMLIDFYPQSPATATAANNLVRCLMGAGGTAVIIYMIDAMGRGWCFTFIALVLAAFSPLLVVLQRKGPAWREERRVKHQRRVEEKAEEAREEGGRVGVMVDEK